MKVQDYLKKSKVAFKVHEHSPAYTAQEVAAEEHVSGKMMAKSVVVRCGKDYALCVLPASHKLDLAEAAKALSVRKAALADETELAKLFPDVEVGAEPPFGNLYDMPTVMDKPLQDDDHITFQAGSHGKAIHMSMDDYRKLVQPKVLAFSYHMTS